MNPETQEKQKKSPLNRKFLLRGLVICVFLMLLPFAGIKAWKQSLYYFYKGLWEQNYQGDYVVYYRITSRSGGILRGDSPDRVDNLWQTAEECLRNFGCEITYSEESYLPVLISFSDDYMIDTSDFFNCDEVPVYHENVERDCRQNGFEPITNNE